MPKDDDPRCFFCSQEVTDDNYCHGCGHYVCPCCDYRDPGAMGGHPVEDHEDEAPYEGEDASNGEERSAS